MNLTKTITTAFKKLFSKSAKTDNSNVGFFDFLGVDKSLDEKALNEATYFACMKVLSEAVGKLPLKLLRYTDANGVETARKHPLYSLLCDRPNPYQTASIFWSTVEFNRNHYGNAYVWIQGAGENMRLWLLPYGEVEVWYDDAKILADQPDIYYKYNHSGNTYVFGSEEILHFKTSNTLDGIMGVSVQNQLKMSINGAVKSQKLLNKMYSSGFTAKAVLNYTGSLNDANVELLIKEVEKYAKGELTDKGIENTIPIPVGFSLNPLNVKLADSQFIEVKQYTSLQIASAFGIKPYQIGDYTKSSYASAEAQQLSFYVDTLLYIIKQYEEELTYKLLSSDEVASGYHFKFNIDVIMRSDFATKVNTLSTAVNSFLMTPNEARGKMDLRAVPGGDRLLGNGASIPVEQTGSQYNNGASGTTPEDPKPEDDSGKNNEGGGQE